MWEGKGGKLRRGNKGREEGETAGGREGRGEDHNNTRLVYFCTNKKGGKKKERKRSRKCLSGHERIKAKNKSVVGKGFNSFTWR